MLRPAHIRHHVRYMLSRGHSAEEVLSGTNVDVAKLNESNYFIDLSDCHGVIANIMRLTEDPGIGLKIGAATKLSDLGIVGYAMASSSSLGQAIGLWLQYGNSHAGFPFTLTPLDRLGAGLWGVSASALGVSGSIYRFYVEEILAMGRALAQQLTGLPFQIVEVSLSYPAPPHAAQYERRLGCPVSFNAPQTRALICTSELDKAVSSNDSEMRELCIRHCGNLGRHISRNGPVSARLRNLLTSSGSVPALDQAAEALNMSPRSLRRRLQDENTSFQRVLDEFRVDLAREYLGAGMMPAKEVAFLLGFSHVDAFRRAFKTWTGQTISEYQLQEARPPTSSNPMASSHAFGAAQGAL